MAVAPNEPEARERLRRKSGKAAVALLLFCGIVLGAAVGWVSGRSALGHSKYSPQDGATLTKPGPWGQLERTPITISLPEELLPVQSFEEEGTHWYFRDFSRDSLAKAFESMGLPADVRERLLSPSVLETVTNGLVLSPPCELLFDLPPKARFVLYSLLAAFPETDAKLFHVSAASFQDRFRDSGVSPDTVSRFRKLGCEHGQHLVFAGLSCMLSTLPTHEEKAHLLTALSRKDTMLVRLHVTPQSDIQSLATYWGKAVWNTDVKAILASLSRVPGGAYVDIIELLPPLPTSLLYTFPVPQNPLNGPVITRDCHWTAFNFFRDPPDPMYSLGDYVRERLRLDFYPVASDLRFGDVLTFCKPDGTIIHSAVFLADDIVYSKNGATALTPWMLSTIGDLKDWYSFQVPAGQKLTVMAYRNKYY